MKCFCFDLNMTRPLRRLAEYEWADSQPNAPYPIAAIWRGRMRSYRYVSFQVSGPWQKLCLIMTKLSALGIGNAKQWWKPWRQLLRFPSWMMGRFSSTISPLPWPPNIVEKSVCWTKLWTPPSRGTIGLQATSHPRSVQSASICLPRLFCSPFTSGE